MEKSLTSRIKSIYATVSMYFWFVCILTSLDIRNNMIFRIVGVLEYPQCDAVVLNFSVCVIIYYRFVGLTCIMYLLPVSMHTKPNLFI